MRLVSILNKIEKIIKKDWKNSSKMTGIALSNSNREISYLVAEFLLKTVKKPLKFFEKKLKDKVIESIKKDAKLYALILGVFMFVFVIFFVLWVFISIAVGIYFKEQGNTYFVSIMYSILFQVFTIPIVGFVAYKSFKNLQSVKIMKEFKNEIEEKVTQK